jgi:GT2 family glycosyltransferase
VNVSVIIPTFNGRHFLGPCLSSLRQLKLPPGVSLQVIVVDNGSTDGSRELLASYPEVTTVHAERPLGYSRANNAARDRAVGEIVCFLNNDTTVEANWLERPLQIFEADLRVAAVGSMLRFMHRYLRVAVEASEGGRVFVASGIFRGPLDDKVRWFRAGLECDVRGIRGRWLGAGGAVYLPAAIEGLDSPPISVPVLRLVAVEGASEVRIRAGQGDSHFLRAAPSILPLEDFAPKANVRLIQNAGTDISSRGEGSDVGSGEEEAAGRFAAEEVVPALCGASLFVRRSALDRAGWFPEYYSSYYEDVDLCLRLRANGGLLVFCPTSVVNHYHTGTNKEWSPSFIENVARSSLLFVSRYAGSRTLVRSLMERAHHIRNEFIHIRGPDRWVRMHGTRGAVKAIPGLFRVASERLVETVKGSFRPSPFTAPRTPYQLHRGH